MGDAIICNGLVRELAKIHEEIALPYHETNIFSIACMFQDLKNVGFVSVTGSFENELEWVTIGCGNPKFKGFRSFDVAFYELAGISFDKRWASFKTNILHPIQPPKSLYILKHEDIKRGFVIQPRHLNPTYPLMEFQGSASVSDYVPLIENALEIHCIDSSMLHLVDSIETKATLFYHKYARNNGPFHQTVKKHKWNVLE